MDILMVMSTWGTLACGLLWLLDKILPAPKEDGEWCGKRRHR